MKIIYDYQLQIKASQFISLPIKHKVLNVKTVNGVPTVWIQVDINEGNNPFEFNMIGNGVDLDKNLLRHNTDYLYIGTFLDLESYTWHLFEQIPI